MQKRWTDKERTKLLALSHKSIRSIAIELGRTPRSVECQLQNGLGIARRGERSRWLSAATIAKRAGVDRRAVKRAAMRLGQAWVHRRVRGRGNRYRIDEDEANELISALRASWNRWSRRHAECRGCGTRGTKGARRHHSHGLCVGCRGNHHRRKESGTNEDEGDRGAEPPFAAVAVGGGARPDGG